MSLKTLETFKEIMDDAFEDASFYVRLKKEEEILTEARKHLTKEEFQELEKYASEKIEKQRPLKNNEEIDKLGTHGPP